MWWREINQTAVQSEIVAVESVPLANGSVSPVAHDLTLWHHPYTMCEEVHAVIGKPLDNLVDVNTNTLVQFRIHPAHFMAQTWRIERGVPPESLRCKFKP